MTLPPMPIEWLRISSHLLRMNGFDPLEAQRNPLCVEGQDAGTPCMRLAAASRASCTCTPEHISSSFQYGFSKAASYLFAIIYLLQPVIFESIKNHSVIGAGQTSRTIAS